MNQKAEARLDELRLTLHGLSAPFSCAGTLVPKQPVTLVFKDQTKLEVTRRKGTNEQQSELKELLERCEPAPFGKQKKTLYDRNVRHAYQLKAANGGFTVANFDPAAAGILKEIQRALLPHDPVPISAELYTVNVYALGGHFVKHKDTPRGDDMFGTLVVCLPSHFSGGDLTLTHRGIVQTFGWANEIRTQKNANQIHWAAFFSDVDHEINRIWFGERVTLTYLLRRGAGGKSAREDVGEDFAPRIEAAWHALLAERSFLPRGGTLAYPCCHLYHQDARLQRKQSPITRRSIDMLKGRDRLVAASARAAGLEVSFNPYMFENCSNDTWQLERFPTRQEQNHLHAQMDDEDLNRILPVREKGEEGGFDLMWLDPPPSPDDTTRRRDSDGDDELAAAAHLHSCEYSPWGYFGNEGTEVDLYTYAALHVEIPELGEGPRPASKPASKRVPTRSTSAKSKPAKSKPAKSKPAKRKRGSSGD